MTTYQDFIDTEGELSDLAALAAEGVPPLVLPCVVDVENESGGAWLFYDGQFGPGFAWLPAGEGIGLNGQDIGFPLLRWTQAKFDGFTDTEKHSYFQIYNDKP